MLHGELADSIGSFLLRGSVSYGLVVVGRRLRRDVHSSADLRRISTVDTLPRSAEAVDISPESTSNHDESRKLTLSIGSFLWNSVSSPMQDGKLRDGRWGPLLGDQAMGLRRGR